jgi:hypothetical protein
MNRNDFLNFIEDKVPVNRQGIGEVYELIDICPYVAAERFAEQCGCEI